jgi:hypothetical protein
MQTMDFEADAQERQAGWIGFTKIMTYATVASIAVLVLLGLITL